VLESQGNSACRWSEIQVEEGFRPVRVRNTHFAGSVKIGKHTDGGETNAGAEKISGIFNAYIANCTIGRDVRIANIGEHIANYNIEDHVCIENVGVMETAPGSTFGNGTEITVLNEAGGREVILFDELSAQFAYLMCLHRHRPKLICKLRAIAQAYVEKVRSDRGKIGIGTHIRTTREIKNVNLGPNARIVGCSSLINGTILSSCETATEVGQDVIAKNFIIAESSEVSEGAILHNTFIGQGCRIGKQFSAENSLFFANSEAFHGEACSVFAGPYTVTHHKSTLLIAGLCSFYNAGSGTNQSNHMYKLGPVHEGRLERGTKTGSFSYMMWPCCVGPFGVVLGKHTGTFDTRDYPFSHHEARPDGKCMMVPGLNLITVGTVRDEMKWPQRDRRNVNPKRDKITFKALSPFTIGTMIKATRQLKHLQDTTDKNLEEVMVSGALIKRPLLRTGQKFYKTGIDLYCLETIFHRAENDIDRGWKNIQTAFAGEPDAVYSEPWVDIGGQLMSRQRLQNWEDAIENGQISTIDQFYSACEKIESSYKKDEWVWLKHAYREVSGIDLDSITRGQLIECAESYLKVKQKFLRLVINDAEKEFSLPRQRVFGQDGAGDERAKDFTAVRGECQHNEFILQMQEELTNIEQRVKEVIEKIARL